MSEPDKDYIIRIIQYLEYRHNITFFINTKDFDALYGWWQKRIPMKVIRESITDVVERWQAKKKPVTSFVNFKAIVRKNFKSFLQLNVGTSESAAGPPLEKTADDSAAVPVGEISVPEPVNEYDEFLANFPETLKPIRAEFEDLFKRIKSQPEEEETVDSSQLAGKLTALFADDPQLNLKSSLFLKNLPAKMRKPEIEARYRLNYLINKFHIPIFD